MKHYKQNINIINILVFYIVISSLSFFILPKITFGKVGDQCWAPVCTDGHYCPRPHQACYTSVCHLVNVAQCISKLIA